MIQKRTKAQIQMAINSIQNEGLFTKQDMEAIHYGRLDLLNIDKQQAIKDKIKAHILPKLEFHKAMMEEYIVIMECIVANKEEYAEKIENLMKQNVYSI